VWQSTFYTNNPKCEVTVNRLEGVSVPRQIKIAQNIQANKAGDFNYKVVLDRYEPGYCGWILETIGYSMNYKKQAIDSIILGYFSNNKNSDIRLQGQHIWNCNISTCSQVKVIQLNKSRTLDSPIRNYQFILKFILKKDGKNGDV
jgi:hypothetical protein